ncbi:glycoside hydrolase family 88 protein [Clostridium folliculivorans]|uniref:Glycosyl hydrolase family 88 n=1 Tax=Clostridium folliculivorans TaxID=2886038 RepID=A0A9W6DBX3_9CLOT|nr:glycoside hydrolase family 88 protein [Clostridium folliculivorans]GKU26729.1 glycosyl hydrolase family 88 [Clostridium folliculivorans]GKU28839.1 glycosyl hydrolase family 88 [Clostridium folliculivorans]
MDYKLNSEDKIWLERTFDKIQYKMYAQCQRIGDIIPYISENGVYDDMGERDITWWTNGFWSGILWQIYNATKEEKYKIVAEKVEKRLDKAFESFDGLHHDVGFTWLHCSIANYRLTANEKSKIRGLHAANLLAGRYNLRGKFIRSWNSDHTGWVIVDSMMNIPILYWASETFDDPRFKFIAEEHAETVRKKIVREDGSCNHIVILDPFTGELIDNPAGQGFETGSSWSRGQAWAIYGFALSYHHTKNEVYLETAKKIAHYFIANVANTGNIPLCDFRSPKEPVKFDTTAGVCAACGLLEIAEGVPEFEKDFYVNSAISILKAIEDKCCDWDIDRDSIVSHGTVAYHDENGQHVKLIYGDYFFIEGVLRLLNKDLFMW